MSGAVALVAVVLLAVSGCPPNEAHRTEMHPQDLGPMVPGDGALAGKALPEKATSVK
jgi:hypothetical protein